MRVYLTEIVSSKDFSSTGTSMMLVLSVVSKRLFFFDNTGIAILETEDEAFTLYDLPKLLLAPREERAHARRVASLSLTIGIH